MKTPIVPNVGALTVRYSPVNQAYFLMWHLQVLNIYNDKNEAIEEYSRILDKRHTNFALYN